MTRIERRAAMAVAAAAAGVIVAGVKLAKRHADYWAKKAAMTFPETEEESGGEEAS